MKILLLGNGGREHAFAWKIKQSSLCKQLFIAPGNAGTASCGTNVSISVTDFEAIREFVLKEVIEMIIVGPEIPLVVGIFDYFHGNEETKHIKIIGPSRQGALLEGSKAYAKQFMQQYKIPTADFEAFLPDRLQAGYDFIDKQNPPIVLKADGLAAGKGVLICEDKKEAKAALEEMLIGEKFGAASKAVVIEQFLDGIEFSVFVLTDGKDYKILPIAKDYKRIGEGDTGLNTGGMGAVSPVPFVDDILLKKVKERIIQPTIDGLQEQNIVYKGFIFFGLINVHGNPYVIEYNCRMGDPETEVVLPRIQNDLVELLQAVADEKLSEKTIEIDERTTTTVMLVSGGYPQGYEKNKAINNILDTKDALIFHAGTIQKNGEIQTNGGRVLAVTAYGKDMQQALAISNKNADLIDFDGKYYRKDIGFDLVNCAKA